MTIKNRRSSRFLVEFPQIESSQLKCSGVVLSQAAYEHDVCELELLEESYDFLSSLKTGEPLKVTWWQGDEKREWLGYLSSYEATSGTNGTYLATAIGNSFPLKTKKPVKLSGKTASQHAKSIAQLNGLKFIGEYSPEIAPTSTTASKTHFEHLMDLAKRAGFVCMIENSNLIFQSYEKTLREASANVPVFLYFGGEIPPSYTGNDKTLDKYEVLSTDYDEMGLGLRNQKFIGGVDPVTSKKFIEKFDPKNSGIATRSNQSNSVFDEQVAEQVALSRGSAKSLARGAATLARFVIPIKLLGQGDPKIRPHSLVYVAGTGKETDGFWYVKKVIHKLEASGTYYTEVIAFTDGLGSSSTFKNQSLTRNGDAVSGLLNLDAYFGSGLNSGSRKEKDVVVKLPGSASRYVESHKLATSSKVKVPTNKTVRNTRPSFRDAPSTWRTTSPTKARTKFE